MAVTDEIKARINIVDVVADYVPDLKKAGRNFHARCPFHQENTPSFVVFPERQTWRCFGACAEGGDVFRFVQKIEGVEFPGALKSLAERAGVVLPERTQRKDGPRNPLFAVTEATLRFYREALQADKGALARAYVEQRQLSEEAVVRFGIGYAPSTGDDLLKHLTALGFTEDQTVSAGVVSRFESGEVRDFIRGRLTFVLRDSEGQVIGFAGRSLDGANPKYLNTSQTELFDKGKMLYGLDRARDAIAREGVAVVVEGYMDVITAHEHGYQNVVASMGTALTEEQVSLLRARAPRVVLALDADAAGQEAMLRSLRTSWQLLGGAAQSAKGRARADIKLRSSDMDALRIALITGGKDPDEMIRTDSSKWRELITNAVPVVDFLLKAETNRLDITTGEGKAEAADLLMPVIYAMSNFLDQERYVANLAEMLSITVAQLQASYERTRAQGQPRQQQQQQQANRQAVKAEAEAVFLKADHDVLDEYVLALIAQYPEVLELISELSPDRVRRPENRALLSAIQAAGTIEGTYPLLDDVAAEHLEHLAAKVLPPADRRQRTADWQACLRRMEERYLRELKAQEEMALAVDANDVSPADPGYKDAVDQQALQVNSRLRDLFVSGTGAP
jgi:DNA primase